MPSAHPVRSLPSLCLCLLGVACADLSEYQLEADEAYCGAMVSAPVFHSGFVPEGEPPALRLRLHLDIDALTTTPGTLTSDDRANGLCKSSDQPLFDEAPLRAIPEVLHDPISTLEFGQGREHTFFAYVDSTCQGSMLAVVSLMKSKDVEVRLFKPAAMTKSDAPAAKSSGYALFHLKPFETDRCGF
ncbi:MAG TPA: hypothetical protein VFU02_14730 [Polyangiaceae bacterium]|nr:hypothetical protein [Polyangiaceae bacterium]